MNKPDRTKYQFTEEQKKVIAAASILPVCHERTQMLVDLFENNNMCGVAFANLMGSVLDVMATVQENTKEVVDMVAIEHFDCHPDKTPRFNLPSVLGALNGYMMAQNVDQNKLCDGCAFKNGTAANTCLDTLHDTQWQQDNSDIFWCHKDMNEDGTPSKKCIGFMKQKKAKNHD